MSSRLSSNLQVIIIYQETKQEQPARKVENHQNTIRESITAVDNSINAKTKSAGRINRAHFYLAPNNAPTSFGMIVGYFGLIAKAFQG